jgi:PKD repeat protein
MLRPSAAGLLAGLILLLVPSSGAAQAVACPNPNPVVDENACKGPGTTSWRMTSYSSSGVAGFTTRQSYALGSSVALKVGRFGGVGGSVDIRVFRMGWYGGTGGRLVHTALGVPVANSFACDTVSASTGLTSCASWSTTHTIPGSALPASGVYLVKLRTTDTGVENQVVFTVRDDARRAKLLVTLPTATYQAYNAWGGKSLYDFNSTTDPTVVGRRAAKISYDRPLRDSAFNGANFYLRADQPLVSWLERQGYDVSYTEDVSVSQDPAQLRNHAVNVIAGHGEYWTREEMEGFRSARDAGVHLASFGANVGYWKVRLEDGGSTLVCYKTVQGTGADGTGTAGVNDPGPDGVAGTADDALGADGRAGTADDRPENSTTTWRDNGAAPGSADAPAAGRVGPDRPENSLLGVMYIGDNDSAYYPLQIPAADGAGQFAGDRIWRRTGITSAGTTVGSRLVGWEWDAVPRQAQYLAQQPANVRKLTASDVSTLNPAFLQDEGRRYAATPPPGQPALAEAVRYTAPSGAQVFSAATIFWSWGLAPHDLDNASGSYQDPAVDSSDPRIQQATYNLFSDMGVQPATPQGITLDSGNAPPTASFTATPNPAQPGQTVTFDASASADTDGRIVRYEWDLDGNGTFERSLTTPTTTTSFATAGTATVRLRVTDDGGATATAERSVVVSGGTSGSYAQQILATPGIRHFWRMGERTGTTLADAAGGAAATTSGSPTLGAAGALAGDTDTAVTFDGIDDAARATVNLSSTTAITVEMWLRWTGYLNQDRLALELTPNFNLNDGGFLIDPDAPEQGGAFGVGIGRGTSRNNAYFARPSASAWHHVALVLDSGAAAASQITPYVDGVAVPYTKTASGTGAGPFANAVLSFMSRNASALFGTGTLDELAIYDRALPASTIAAHVQAGTSGGGGGAPTASFTATPNPAQVGQTVAFDASASTGSPTRFEWDLDGNGTFETDTGTTRTTSRAYTAAGTVTVGLRVTGGSGATATTTRTVTVQAAQGSSPPVAVLADPGILTAGRSTTLDASGSNDPDGGAIVRYELDLDGDGTFERSGTDPRPTATFNAPGERTIRLRVTDDEGQTATTSRTLLVRSPVDTPVPAAIRSQPSLQAYWRMGDQVGPRLLDHAGTRHATTAGGPTLGTPGALAGDPDTAVSFDGLNDTASAPLALSGAQKVTIELWLRWRSYANDDRLALELTPNFNTADGGIIVDPNDASGRFAIGMGRGNARTSVLMDRPSAGVWHHLAIVLDPTAAAASRITPYVDGAAVPTTVIRAATTTTRFADASLYVMSRGGTALFGAGDVDELAVFTDALSASTIAAHRSAGTGGAAAR